MPIVNDMIFKLALSLAHTLCGALATHRSKSTCTSRIKEKNEKIGYFNSLLELRVGLSAK